MDERHRHSMAVHDCGDFLVTRAWNTWQNSVRRGADDTVKVNKSNKLHWVDWSTSNGSKTEVKQLRNKNQLVITELDLSFANLMVNFGDSSPRVNISNVWIRDNPSVSQSDIHCYKVELRDHQRSTMSKSSETSRETGEVQVYVWNKFGYHGAPRRFGWVV